MDSSLINLPEHFTSITSALAEGRPLSTVFPTFTGFRRWIKLFLIGGAFETCRRVTLQVWGSILDSFWITIDLENDTHNYSWMMLWLSQHPKFAKARRFAINDSAPGMESSVVDSDDPTSGRKAHFLLAYNHAYTFWHKRRYIRAIRVKEEYSSRASLHISIFGGGRRMVDDLLAEARECWKRASEERVSVYASDTKNEWRLTASPHKRPPDSIILDSGVKEEILRDAREFLGSKKWYSERGIPFRRGYLLYGVPGSGKTSLIQSVAGELNLDVYVISLSRTGLNDNALRELISLLPERCIALMEDIDVAFHHTLTRDLPEEGKTPEEIKGPQGPHGPPPPVPLLPPDRSGRVSLSGLLNALDGVGAQEGRILFATTNRFEALDPALRRPGRIDYYIEFKLASQYQVGELFKKFYLPTPHASTAQWPPYKDLTTSKGESSNRRTSDSGYGSPVGPGTEKIVDVRPPTGVQDQPLAAIVHRSNYDFEVSSEELDSLVERFREAIPEREFSMAALQGYLLMHKDQPQRAVECAEKWVKEQMTKRGSG